MTPKPLKRIEQFEQLAYGMFIHYGLYSQLGRGEWVMNKDNISREEYRKLKDTFTAADFNGREIAKIARQSGMKYICLTTRHHEGFSLYDTKGLNDYDALHCPAQRDLVMDFVNGCREEGIVPFFYHTTLDWSVESYEKDFDAYLEYLNQSVEILCRNYGTIGGLWFDGNWDKPDADWKEQRLYATIRKYQPDAIIVNNTGLDARGKTGNPELDVLTYERGRPEPLDRSGMPKYLAAEMCLTMNQHWGIGKDDFNYLSPKELIEDLCACRKVGANLLLNVGPTAEGKIPDYEKGTFLRIGQWLHKYSDIISKAKPCGVKVDADKDFALEMDGSLYIFVHDLSIIGDSHVTIGKEAKQQINLSCTKDAIKDICWLDNNQPLDFTQNREKSSTAIKLTGYPYGTDLVVRIAKVSLK